MIDWKHELELSHLHDNGDYLHHEGLLEFSHTNTKVRYRKRDFLFSPGKWRGELVSPIVRREGAGKLLIVGHSDMGTTPRDVAKIRLIGGYKSVLAANLTSGFWQSRLLGGRPLPLGLTNPTNESELHKVYGDASLLTRAFQTRRLPFNAGSLPHIYCNFSSATAPEHRLELEGLVGGMRHIFRGRIDITKAGRLAYLSEIRNAGLVICPRGHGQDTHRLYETLYLGAIPIVLKNSYQFRLCTTYGFPVVGLRNWGELANFDLITGMGAKAHFSPQGIENLRLSKWQSHLL